MQFMSPCKISLAARVLRNSKTKGLSKANSRYSSVHSLYLNPLLRTHSWAFNEFWIAFDF